MASGGHEGQHAGCLDEVGVWGPLWQGVVAHGGGGAYNPQDIAERLAMEDAMCETVCRCSGRCKCKAPAPKFQWMRQAEMPECWKYMVPKLTAAGVVALSCCLSYEQFWQYCGACGVKVLREGGETSMPAQILHVTNQGQSVRQRVKEGMKGRPVGLPDNPPPPPCPCGGDLREAPMYTSLVYNEVVGLHVHNQQEYKLVVDHEFLDCLGWQWSLHAMVLHIGSTREEGHFVVYVVFNNRWWLCNDTTVKAMTPPPRPVKSDVSAIQAETNRFGCTRHVAACLPTDRTTGPWSDTGCPERTY